MRPLQDPSRNHKSYRDLITSLRPPLIPFTPLLLKGQTLHLLTAVKGVNSPPPWVWRGGWQSHDLSPDRLPISSVLLRPAVDQMCTLAPQR